ncbi:UPF0125 protein [Polaromonas sp.]|nr:UPF0125 protein [Polaromonas sp.]
MALMLTIYLLYSPAARQVNEWQVELEAGATVGQALQASRLFEEFPALKGRPLTLGIWGVKAGLNNLLQDQDRIEIYRPLRVDPKVARRERFNRQGTKGTGLFAQTRPGAKAGY